MNTSHKNKMFSNSIALSLLTLFSVFLMGVGNAFAADPQFNYMSNDLKTLRIGNYTTDGGTYNWYSSITANPGNRISIDVYYHNGVVGTVANNTRARVTFPTGSSSQMTLSGSLLSSNAPQVNDTVILNITSAQTITFESQARWLPNQQTGAGTLIPVTNNGNSVEVNIGDIAGGWATQGHVTFYANVSNNPAGNPTVNAGVDRSINELATAALSATATDPQGLSMSYSWICSGGSLDNSTILNPVFTAPSVSSTTTYTCTLTARNSNQLTGSDSVNITVNDTIPPDSNAPIVNAGVDRSINELTTTTLTATATDPHGLAMTYSWICNGGSLSNTVILNPVYTAPAVSSSTTYTCNFTATNSTANSSSDTVNITVLDTNGGGGSGGSIGGGSSSSVSVSLAANPTSGLSPLNGVSLTANVNAWGIADNRTITYMFDCENNNSWDLRVDTTGKTYVANGLCNYAYDGQYTAKVKVIADGYEAWNQVVINVGNLPGGGSYGVNVDAGSNKDIGENQSVLLTGYASSQFGYALTYYWTCNGGSLINASTLTPTYYAPMVNVDSTYGCTLYVTDSRGFRNSDMVSIVVRNTGANYSTGLKVTTATPESTNATSVTLKGILDSDGGQYSSVRFNWGVLSSYNNTTPWVANKTSGQSFTYFVSGLEKGKAYHYRAEASNGREVVMGQDISFITKPDATTGFTATAAGSGQISLGWNRGASSCFTMVTRKAGSYPINSSDGTIVYYGTGTSVIDKNLNNGTWYYYRAWSVGCDEGLISYSESQNARAYASSGVTGYVAPIVKEEAGVSVEALARDTTQNEIAWQNSITSSPNDEIEFKVIITPTGSRSLEDVILKAVLSDKISSINDIKVNEESYGGKLDSMNLGTIALGESKIITFKGKVDSRQNFNYGSNKIVSTAEISAKNNATVNKTVTIDVTRSVEGEAGLISLLDLRAYAGILTILLIILSIIVMYLLIERRKGKECLVEKAATTKVEKSKYFNIK